MFSRVTIKDIAQRAGVSPGTVDRVLHGRGNVSPDARIKVERAMEELHYEPNIIASTLAYNRTLRVAALLPDFRSDLYWILPKSGVERAVQDLRHYGIQIEFSFHSLSEPAQFLSLAEEILDTGPDALLFAPIFLEPSRQILKLCTERKIPAALINTDLEDQDALCYVGQDSYHSGVLAGKLLHLVLNPVREVAVLNLDKEIMHARHLLEKERGLRDYFTNHPEPVEVLRLDFENFDQPGLLREFMLNVFAQHPLLRGIFVSNSRSYKVLAALGPLAPPDLRIVGFDLLEPNMEYLDAGKIAFLINQNPGQQGYQAVQSIVHHLVFKKQVERIQYLPLDIVVTENASYYLAREKTFQAAV